MPTRVICTALVDLVNQLAVWFVWGVVCVGRVAGRLRACACSACACSASIQAAGGRPADNGEAACSTTQPEAMNGHEHGTGCKPSWPSPQNTLPRIYAGSQLKTNAAAQSLVVSRAFRPLPLVRVHNAAAALCACYSYCRAHCLAPVGMHTHATLAAAMLAARPVRSPHPSAPPQPHSRHTYHPFPPRYTRFRRPVPGVPPDVHVHIERGQAQGAHRRQAQQAAV